MVVPLVIYFLWGPCIDSKDVIARTRMPITVSKKDSNNQVKAFHYQLLALLGKTCGCPRLCGNSRSEKMPILQANVPPAVSSEQSVQ